MATLGTRPRPGDTDCTESCSRAERHYYSYCYCYHRRRSRDVCARVKLRRETLLRKYRILKINVFSRAAAAAAVAATATAATI